MTNWGLGSAMLIFNMASKIKEIFSQITVEPINLLFLLGQLSVEPVREDFFLQTICKHNFPNGTMCENTSNYSSSMKVATETAATTYITIWFISVTKF